MDFGTELRVAIARARINQKILGRLVGVHAMTVNRWIVGQRVPSDEHLAKIRELLTLDTKTVRAFARDAGMKRPRKNARQRKPQ